MECARAAVRGEGYLRSYYRWNVRKFGGFKSPVAKKKAVVATAHKLAVIIWHVLVTGIEYHDPGKDYYTTRLDPVRENRRMVDKLQAQGYTITAPAAA